MSYDIFLPDCDMQRFRNAFVSKAEYKRLMGEMSFKEALSDRKATGLFEENLRKHIADNALIKTGTGGIITTSYIVSENESSTIVYVSSGGKNLLNLTSEGRDRDFGHFLVARQSDGGVRLHIESRREHYKTRTWIINAVLIVFGLILAVVPGILIALLLIFVEPMVYRKKVEKNIVPVLKATFERIQ